MSQERKEIMHKIMEQELEIEDSDAKRFLSQEEYEDLIYIHRLRHQGLRLHPLEQRDRNAHYDKIRQKKDEEHAKAQLLKIKKEIKEDVLQLKKDLTGVLPIQNRTAAIHHLAKSFPASKQLLEKIDPLRWVPQRIKLFGDPIKEEADEIFQYYTMKLKHPEAFNYQLTSSIIPIPEANYMKRGISNLEFNFFPYIVITLKIRQIGYEKYFAHAHGETYKIPPSQEPVAYCNVAFRLNEQDYKPIKITAPLNLLSGFSAKKLEPEGCEIIKQEKNLLTYRVEGFSSEISLTLGFINFFREKDDPFQELMNLSILSEIGLAILKEKERHPIAIPDMRKKDKKHLKKISDTSGFLTYQEWGGLLGITREGAYGVLKRFQDLDLLTLDKHSSGKGTRATLTERGVGCHSSFGLI